MHRKVLQPTVMVEPSRNVVGSGLVSTYISTKSHFWLGLCTVNSLNVCLRMLLCNMLQYISQWLVKQVQQTKVCCIVPEKPADAISGTDNQLLGMAMSIIAGLNRHECMVSGVLALCSFKSWVLLLPPLPLHLSL